jgi:iron complex outermembrane receptor protein
MSRMLLSAFLGHAAFAALLSSASAQDVPATPPDPAAETDASEEVVVTAQRRKENVQKVPLAISAIAGDKLDAQAIVGFEDLGTRVPSLRFGSGVTGGEHVITLRGLSSQNTTSGGDSPVAYNVDGVYLARSTAVDSEFFDISRIEVLRGPQGTLYGRNSVGGSVNVITNKPDSELAAYADVMLGDYGAFTGRAWANLPLTGETSSTKVYARLTGVYAEHDPYQSNDSTLPGATRDGDAQDFYLVRGQLLFQFSDDVQLLLSASTTSNGSPVATKLAWGAAPLANQARFIGQTYNPDPRSTSAGWPERFDQKNDLYSATLDWDLGGMTLTSVTAFTTGEWFQTNDADSTSLDIAHLNYWTMDSEQFSQEIRLASDNDNALRWIVGAYYFREKVNQGFQYVDTGLNAPFGTGFVFTNGGDIKTTSWAAFGQIDYDLSKTSMDIPLTLTVGLRYTSDTKAVDDFLNYNIPDFAFNLALAKSVEPSWNKLTGKVGLAWQATDDIMVYASVATGYLAGGELVGNFPGIYDPETVTNYEAGIKSVFANGSVVFNAALFHTSIEDMQVFVQDITGSRIDNAGKAHVTGFEAEGIFYLTESLRVNAALSLMEAEYDEYVTIDNRIGVPANFAGNRLVQTPEYTVSIGAEYTIETEYGTFTPRADVFWSGDLYFLSANSPYERQKPYTIVDLGLTWTDPSDRWTVMGFVRNAGDTDVISNDGLQSATIGLGFGIDNFTYYPPRTWGLRVGAKF